MNSTKYKLSKTKLVGPPRVFSIELHKQGIINRINALGFNIAISETKLELCQLVEAEFQKYLTLKKYHT